MPKISVIVPIHNVEPYIHQCVDSILAQTFSDFELILVDDGSPDGCPRICDEYAARDGRVRVVHKKNGGLSDARNAGLDVMAGQFVTFIDSDDAVHPQYLETLLCLLESTGADISACHYDFFREDGDWFSQPLDIPGEVKQYAEMTGAGLLEEFPRHCRRVSLVSQCMKLYKREIFHGLRMEVGRIQEDSLILPYVLERTGRIVKTSLPLYHWRITPGSISRSAFNRQDFDHIHLCRMWAGFFESRNAPARAAHFQREFLQRVLKYYYKTQDEAPELMDALKPYLKLYRKLFPRYIRAGGMCPSEKAAYALFLLSPKGARGLYERVYGQEDAK